MDEPLKSRGVRCLPRLRFSVAALMITVGVVGSALGAVMERRSRFLRLAAHHRAQVVGVHHIFAMGNNGICRSLWLDNNRKQYPPSQRSKDQWHGKLSDKYASAAAHPWLPVAADPAEP